VESKYALSLSALVLWSNCSFAKYALVLSAFIVGGPTMPSLLGPVAVVVDDVSTGGFVSLDFVEHAETATTRIRLAALHLFTMPPGME